MVLTLLTLAAALAQEQPAPVPQPVARPAITVTGDTVELTGAGTLAFTADVTAYLLNPSALNGNAFATARLWLDAGGKPVDCQERASPQPTAAHIACEQLLKSARFTLYPGMAMPVRRGFVDVGLTFMAAEHRIATLEKPAYTNGTIAYPEDTSPVDARLAATDGRLSASVTVEDYPPLALRNGLESASVVLLGIDRTGQPQTCRPLNNGGAIATAYLDNYTCRLLLRRAHFTFTAGAGGYSGVRYVRQSLRWTLPRN